MKLVETEEQMLFVFHLVRIFKVSKTFGAFFSLCQKVSIIKIKFQVGPFLQRLHSERFMRVLFELTVQLYEILLRVDKNVKQMKYMDAVCDLLYHIKYQVLV